MKHNSALNRKEKEKILCSNWSNSQDMLLKNKFLKKYLWYIALYVRENFSLCLSLTFAKRNTRRENQNQWKQERTGWERQELKGTSQTILCFIQSGAKYVYSCEFTRYKFILILLFINYCVIFHTNNFKPIYPTLQIWFGK